LRTLEAENKDQFDCELNLRHQRSEAFEVFSAWLFNWSCRY